MKPYLYIKYIDVHYKFNMYYILNVYNIVCLNYIRFSILYSTKSQDSNFIKRDKEICTQPLSKFKILKEYDTIDEILIDIPELMLL